MVFCNLKNKSSSLISLSVTILILIDGFLQYIKLNSDTLFIDSHNPYFNRWFSAMSYNLLDSNDYLKSQSLF